MDSPDPKSNAAEGMGVGAGLILSSPSAYCAQARSSPIAIYCEHLHIRRANPHPSSLGTVLHRLTFSCLGLIVRHSPSDYTAQAPSSPLATYCGHLHIFLPHPSSLEAVTANMAVPQQSSW